ncbi:MAG: hypothetical protein ACI4OX_00840 [Akkermansia sp.]
MRDDSLKRWHRALKRFALAEDWERVRALIEERLRENPEDTEAVAELGRLMRGEPLQATESPAERRARLQKENARLLAEELVAFRADATCLSTLEEDELQERLDRVAGNDSAVRDYHRALRHALRLRRGRRVRRVALWCALGVLCLSGFAVLGRLHMEARRAEEQVRLCMASGEWLRLPSVLAAADTSANVMFFPALRSTISLARQKLDAISGEARSLESLLSRLSMREGAAAELSEAEKKRIDRRLEQLPLCFRRDMPARWQALVRGEFARYMEEKNALCALLTSPLPQPSEFTGNAAEDEAALRAEATALQQRVAAFAADGARFSLPDELLSDERARLKSIKVLLADFAAMRQLQEHLPIAKSYAHYLDLLSKFKPHAYPPALRLKKVGDFLPREEDLRRLMQAHGRALSPEMLGKVRRTLVKCGPSFPEGVPASSEQVQLMEEPLTAQTLRRPFYELSMDGVSPVLSGAKPVVREDAVCFSRHPMDPDFVAGESQDIIWRPASLVKIRTINAEKLVEFCGLEKDDFFRVANLPSVLSRVAAFRSPICPALAKAFVYRRVLETIRRHPFPPMVGMRFSPSLMEDARSFDELLQRLPVTPEGDSWLQHTPEYRQAEEMCAQWFSELPARWYHKEIAHNFESLMRVRPAYAGFISETGVPVLCSELPEDATLWYVSEGEVTAAPRGGAFADAMPYSPVFVVKKSF